MKSLIWSGAAKRDLFHIADYYDGVEDGLGTKLLDNIIAEPLLLLDFPAAGELVNGSRVRKWRVKKTPFILVYEVVEQSVEIRRVLHAASDWKTS